MRLKLWAVIVLLGLVTVSAYSVVAQENNAQTNLEQKISEYQKRLTELRLQKNTLASQIQYMDTQIYLTILKIQETEQKIAKTQKEIELLTARIVGLDNSLNYLSKTLLERVVQSYKQSSVSFLTIILDSNNASDLINRIKYFKTTQENNQKTLFQVQTAKTNFEEQKLLREEKKIELDRLNVTLSNQQITLQSQKNQKQKLLADTQNDENVYQRLLADAEIQLKAFKTFVQKTGVGVISANQLGSGSDGAYFSQRDARWAYKTIGYSSETVLDVGCLLTSISIVAKKNGENITPLEIAADVNRYFGSTAWMRLPWLSVAGKSYNSITIESIDSELNNGRPVIAGVRINDCYAGGNHFVVLIKKEGDDYIMHDPVYGPDIKFNQHYSSICSAATFN